MAHMLDFVDGKASVAYVGEAWHGLGVSIDAPVTSAEMVQLAGIGWGVQERPLMLGNEVVPNIRALIRDDRPGLDGLLSVVSDRYKPIQNKECFAFADTLVGEGHAIWHTAGAIRGGRDVWALAKLPGDAMEIVPGDAVEKYLLFTNNHEGSRAARIRFTPIRVVCANTLSAAIETDGGSQTARIWHTGNLVNQFKDAAELLGLATKVFDQTAFSFSSMAKKQLSAEHVAEYFSHVIPDAKGETQAARTRVENTRRLLYHLYEHGRGSDIPGVRGTVWGAYNAVAEFIDHMRLSKSSESTRLYSSWYSRGDTIRSRAFEQAVVMAS
jgi:phage/plasmid-like protein (TIGR03299 family)